MAEVDLTYPRAIDLLSNAFGAVGGVVRTAHGFHTTTPWATARFGPVRLSPGWWSFESEGESDELEFRVFDDVGLVLASRPSRDGAVNLFVGRMTVAHIDLVLSPWPADVRFRKLCFRRLTQMEVAGFLARRILEASRGERPLSRIASAALRLLSGASLASRATAPQPPAAHAADPMLPASETNSKRATVMRRDDITYVLGDMDRIDARTLDVVAKLFHDQPEVAAAYGDIVEGGRLLPAPQWDDERAKWMSLARLPIFFRGSGQDIDVHDAWGRLQEIVRISGDTAVARIPLPVAVRMGPVDRNPAPRLPIPVRSRWPGVSVIIPTKQRTDLLAKCLEGLRTLTDYPDLEIVVVDNGADPQKLGALLKAEGAFQRIAHVYDGGDFNFSRLINSGVRASQGEVLLLLNDDVMALESGWLHRMIDSALEPATGAVGARLVYSSGDIQHAGVMLGLGGICGHLWRHQSAEDAARNPHIVYPGRRMAVTGACLAVRREAFDQVGGLDEVNYPVTLNDIDFCLRLDRAGFRTIYRGDAVLLHDESQSRGNDDEERRKRERRRSETRTFRRMWGHLLDNDPFASPAFDLSTETGAVYIPSPQIFL